MRQFKQKSFIVGKCDIFCRKMRQLINFFLYLDLDQMKVSLDLKLTTCEGCDMLMTKKHLTHKHKCKNKRKAEDELSQELANKL